MSKLSEFYGRKSDEPGADKYSVGANEKRGDGEHLAYVSFSDTGSRIDEEKEALRNLLVDTEHKISELDDLKDAFGKFVVRFNKTLRSLEPEKSQNASLKDTLGESRSVYKTLRTHFYEAKKNKTTAEQLWQALETAARETARGLESNRTELTSEIAANHVRIAELERQLAQESAQCKALSENKRMLVEHVNNAEKRMIELKAELAAAREKLVPLEDEKRPLQLSLDQTLNETSRLNRRLTESESTLTAIRAQLGKMEASFTEAFAERGKLSAALAEAKEQHKAERNAQNVRVDALQSRAATAEKLLAEAQQNVIARTEEVRAFDRRAVEATAVRNNADKKPSHIEAAHKVRERQIKDLEQSPAALVKRTSAMTKILKTRETALTRAKEKIQSLTERTGHVEADIQVSRTNNEKHVEDSNFLLQCERMESAIAKVALEATRKDNPRLPDWLRSTKAHQRHLLGLADRRTR